MKKQEYKKVEEAIRSKIQKSIEVFTDETDDTGYLIYDYLNDFPEIEDDRSKETAAIRYMVEAWNEFCGAMENLEHWTFKQEENNV